MNQFCFRIHKSLMIKSDLHCFMCRRGKVKYVVKLTDELSKGIAEGKNTPKKHDGRLKCGTIRLPQTMRDSMKAVVKDNTYKQVVNDAQVFSKYLEAREPPVLPENIQNKASELKRRIIDQQGIKKSELSDLEKMTCEKNLEKAVARMLPRHIYNWKSIDYSTHIGKQYIVSRMSGDYAVLYKIFLEINQKLPEFQPVTLFDFGSGVGTVMWAAREYWKKSLKEYFCVDISRDMNELSLSLLKGGASGDAPLPFNNVYHRQFLPASSALKYDLVVVSYTLMDLPSMESRLETLLTLWNKTNEFLIVVDRGNANGFKLINEARDFILDIDSQDTNSAGVHVFSPCPHEFECPQMGVGKRCSFYVTYEPPDIDIHNTIQKRFYSYVVLRKGKRPENDPCWARVIRPVLVRKKHCYVRTCASDGLKKEIIFSRHKYDISTYHTGRSLKWGDQFPGEIMESSCPDDEMESEVGFESDFDSSDSEEDHKT